MNKLTGMISIVLVSGCGLAPMRASGTHTAYVEDPYQTTTEANARYGNQNDGARVVKTRTQLQECIAYIAPTYGSAQAYRECSAKVFAAVHSKNGAMPYAPPAVNPGMMSYGVLDPTLVMSQYEAPAPQQQTSANTVDPVARAQATHTAQELTKLKHEVEQPSEK